MRNKLFRVATYAVATVILVSMTLVSVTFARDNSTSSVKNAICLVEKTTSPIFNDFGIEVSQADGFYNVDNFAYVSNDSQRSLILKFDGKCDFTLYFIGAKDYNVLLDDSDEVAFEAGKEYALIFEYDEKSKKYYVLNDQTKVLCGEIELISQGFTRVSVVPIDVVEDKIFGDELYTLSLNNNVCYMLNCRVTYKNEQIIVTPLKEGVVKIIAQSNNEDDKVSDFVLYQIEKIAISRTVKAEQLTINNEYGNCVEVYESPTDAKCTIDDDEIVFSSNGRYLLKFTKNDISEVIEFVVNYIELPIVPDPPIEPDPPVVPDPPIEPDPPVVPDPPIEPDLPVIPDPPIEPELPDDGADSDNENNGNVTDEEGDLDFMIPIKGFEKNYDNTKIIITLFFSIVLAGGLIIITALICKKGRAGNKKNLLNNNREEDFKDDKNS